MSTVQMESRLVGTWRHAHEEDSAEGTVYRPESYDFPPSRGRVGFTLRADHTATFIGLSPRDGSTREACTWRLGGSARSPVLELTWPDGRSEAWPVVELSAGRLRLDQSR